MTRPRLATLTAALVLAATAAVSAVATTGAVDRHVAPVEDGVTVVAEAILASTPFEQAAAIGAAAEGTAAAATPGCQAKPYALAAWRMPATFTWYYNPAAAPASVAASALPAIKSATNTLFSARSRCGTATTTVTTGVYAGTSTKAAQVSPKGTCTGNDNVSVTSWGALPASVLAYTCVYYRTGSKTVLSSDVLIDNKVHKWFTTKPAG
ncbi:hypothetical protein, partial [Actinophytocola xanthii]